jgi:hypothetical protein
MHTYEDSSVRDAIRAEIERTQTLNDLMTFGHVVYSDGNGTVTDEYDDTVYGPEIVYVETDNDGSIVRYGNDDVASERYGIDMAGYGDWELLHGFSGQYGYNGSIMHPSEFIGGGLERHIRENAGYYVAVMVDTYGEDDDGNDRTVGWSVAFHEVWES